MNGHLGTPGNVNNLRPVCKTKQNLVNPIKQKNLDWNEEPNSVVLINSSFNNDWLFVWLTMKENPELFLLL